MRVGIFFGGKSREREISFAGGRTVFDNLDKSVYLPVPVFIDSLGNFILLNWQYLYKGTIRDFYPPNDFLPQTKHNFQLYIENLGELTPEKQDEIARSVGTPLKAEELKQHMDFAFLCLHGPYGEDGSLQGLLEYYDIPYSGSGIFPSAIGIDKSFQKVLFKSSGFSSPDYFNIRREDWLKNDAERKKVHKLAKEKFGFPLVIKASSQGSSIGVSILKEDDEKKFTDAVFQSFFIKRIDSAEWQKKSSQEKVEAVRVLTDIRDGIGLPVEAEGNILNSPEEVLQFLEAATGEVWLQSIQQETRVVIEQFIKGKEFSCIVVQDDNGNPIALPPTEIRKSGELFDYRSKYLPGMSNKVTPIELPEEQIEAIRTDCENLYKFFRFNVYARLDGIISEEGTIYLNDPNTTSGMLPSSFFFHQAAEIGLSPGQFLNYIIRASLQERIRNSFRSFEAKKSLQKLDGKLKAAQQSSTQKTRVAVVFGGYSTERHISVESGRNVYEKLASSGNYDAKPVFLSGSEGNFRFHILPVNLMLKDNADDIRHKIENFKIDPIIGKIISEAEEITNRFAAKDYDFHPRELSLEEMAREFDFVFMALHGRPGEDGTLQAEFEKYNLGYNGSGTASSSITIDKFRTTQILRENGFLVADGMMVTKEDWQRSKEDVIKKISQNLSFPIIAKPSDDGCSSAVKKINSAEELETYATLMFRHTIELPAEEAKKLNLKVREEFPVKSYFMVEELISPKGADHFLEVTGGMVTHKDNDLIIYEVFEPSEALAQAGILSLEEKFLAGEGQNITPARFSRNKEKNRTISHKVRQELERAARVLGIEGYCRIDAFVRIYENERVEVIFIEVNSLPGLTPATCIFHQAAINNYKPQEFLGEIIDYGIQKVKN